MPISTMRFCLDRRKHEPIHLAAQGSWELLSLASFPTSEDYSFSALSALSGFCHREEGGWSVTIIREPVETISMKLEGAFCHLEFSAEQVELSAVSNSCSTWEEVITWIRSQLGLDHKKERSQRVERVFCLDIHDFQGNLLQGFADIQKLKQLTDERGLTGNSLFYLPGWDGKYDGSYPDYQASREAGGLEKLIEVAHNLRSAGAEIFLHLNHWAISEDRLEAYPELKNHLIRDKKGVPAMWPGATWCGATNPLYYVQPDALPWMRLVKEKLGYLESQGLHGFFLDQLGAAPGLQASRTAEVFAREVCSSTSTYGMEVPMVELAEVVAIAQWWGAAWCGAPEKIGLKMSPLLADVYAPWIQMMGHLGTPAPYPIRYSWTNYVFLAERGIPEAFQNVWEAHRDAHVLPTLRLNSRRSDENARLLDHLFAPRS